MKKTLAELSQKYGSTMVDEDEFKKALNIKEEKVWKPESCENVYALFGNGKIDYNHVSLDTEKYYKMGNVYKTKEDAEFAREKQIFLTKFERYLRENEDEPVDWKNINQEKWSLLCIDCDVIHIGCFYVTHYQGVVYTTNKLALEKFIKDNESDIKKYMFGVE